MGSGSQEEGAPPEDGSTTDPPSPSTEPAPDPAPRTGRRRAARIALLGGLLAAITIAIIVIAQRGPARTAGSGGAIGSGGSGAAIRAPEHPSLGADDPTGVRLTGFVIDGAGQPVAGAEVTAEVERGVIDKALAPAPPPPSSPVVDAGVATDASATPIVHTGAPTGVDGRFAIGGLAPGRYHLRVTGKGLLPAEVRFVPVPSDATRIVVARQVGIAGVVLDEGKPAAGVVVGLRGDAIGGGIERKSDAAGAFAFENLPEGRYQVYAHKGSLAARAVRVNRLGTGPFAPVELRLEPASIVIGRVIDKDEGTGLVAAIELRPAGDDQAPRYARSGDDGVFRIEGVPNGRWIADAYAPGYLSPGGVELEAGKGIPELALARGASIEGRVVDGDGAPIAGATVRALEAGDNPTETSQLVEQDKLRRFSGILLAQAPAASAGAAAGDPSFLPRGELGVMLGPIPPLPAPGAAVARPATLDLTAGPTAAVMAQEPAPLPAPARPPIWLTGPDGRFRIDGLAKSKLVVLAVAPGFAEGRSKQVAVEGAQVVTGVDVVLAAGTVLVGKVTDQHRVPVVGAQISARPAIGLPMDTFTDGAGEYRLGPVTGTLELVASSYGHGDARRTVELAIAKGRTAAEHREDFVLVVADAMFAGTLDDANGTAVAGAQLEVIGGAGDGRRAVAGADGTFSIDMLPAGPLRVRIRHPDYPLAELDGTATTGGAQRARLRLPLGGAVEGAVIEAASGAPVTSIVIAATGPGGAAAEATTDKQGRWKLGPVAPGAWRLAIKLPGFLAFSRTVEVTASRTPGATSVRDVRLELQRGALLGGTVRDDRGQRLAGATVSVRLAAGGDALVEGTTDAMGEFKLRDVPTGELIVGASKDGRGGSTRATVRPGDEILGLSIDVR